MSVRVVMTICDFAIQGHELAIPVRTAVLFWLKIIKIVSPNYPFCWSGASGWTTELLVLKLAEFGKFTIVDMLTIVAAAVSRHARIVERSYGGER